MDAVQRSQTGNFCNVVKKVVFFDKTVVNKYIFKL